MNLQFFANKNIILHPPKQDGTMDTDTNLYPQTKAENIEGLDAKLATKQDAITQANPLSALNVQVSDVFDTDVDAKAAFGMLKSGKQDVSNLVTSITSSSTNAEYPSAKAVYDYVDAKITSSLGGNY